MLFNKLDELSHRVMQGEVVFFVGAGFSLDSEKNISYRLVTRLIVRFSSIIKEVLNCRNITSEEGKCCSNLIDTLKVTFELGKKAKIENKKNLEKLSKEYYQINDWICNAYNILIKILVKIIERDSNILKSINKCENKILKKSNSVDYERLEEIDIKRYEKLSERFRGKALFLDTMGFCNHNIMAGNPYAEDINDVLTSYHNRLLKRHHILARLAREGFSNPLITTNYDLLLEGAYRLAGFSTRELGEAIPDSYLMYSYFKSIGDANQFFHSGDGYKTAIITKIHGCVRQYRDCKTGKCTDNCDLCEDKSKNGEWEKYLHAMVFTFREIQNWREDAWSRDYLRNLLRTKTIAFLGYSVSDPVLHDTFRSVYEEMGKKKEACASLPVKYKKKTPAFFFGIADKKEFHGMEILRAASRSVEEQWDDITEHENYLYFHKMNQDKFPNMDESMQWLFHIICRKQQLICLKNNIQQLARFFWKRPCSIREQTKLLENFEELMTQEKDIAKLWDDKPKHRYVFYRIINWTEYFHIGLLKLYAMADDLLYGKGVSGKTGIKYSPSWYYPFSGNSIWTAWGAIFEMGFRKIIASYNKSSPEWENSSGIIEVLPTYPPRVSISNNDIIKTPVLLELDIHAPNRPEPLFTTKGVYRKKFVWKIRPDELPWNHNEQDKSSRQIPDAKYIWDWAVDKPGLTPDKYFKEEFNE